MALTDIEAIDAAKAFRPKTPPIAIAGLVNLIVAALCLGVPYYRGHTRAQESLRAFSRFAGCLFDAQPQANLGLGFPPGERDHFAAQVLRASRDWPGRCKKPLRAIAPAEAVFLWPSVKQAGADVRAVVALVEQEVSALERKRQMDAGGRVSSRPLLAVSKLRAALTLLARAAGTDEGIDANAVRFDKPAQIALPARLPLMAGPSAALDVWAGVDGLRATAMDSRGLSWLHVEDGKIDHRRVRRTSLVRATLRDEQRHWIVWAMARDRCEQAEDHCVHRTTGIADFDAGAAQLPVPFWLGGHPAERIDRSMRAWLRTTIDLLSLRDADGAIEVRRFELPHSDRPTAAREDDPPLAAVKRFALPVDKVASAVLIEPQVVAYALPDADGARAFLSYYEGDPPKPPLDLGRVTGQGAWVEACVAPDALWIVFGTRGALAVSYIKTETITILGSGTRVSAVLPETPIALDDPLHASDPALDRLHVWCDASSATAVAVTASNTLIVLRCDTTHCEASPALARDVAAFDAKPMADAATLIAYSQRSLPQLVVARLERGATQLESIQTPAACWDTDGGMCGQPTLVTDSGRILLCARDGTDLLAIESEDNGRRWKTMSGLQGSASAPSDLNEAMRQHRLRKGLDL